MKSEDLLKYSIQTKDCFAKFKIYISKKSWDCSFKKECIEESSEEIK